MADLHVTVLSRSIVKSSDTSKKPYNLPPSNFDTFPGPFPAVSVYIYPKPSNGNFSSVVATMKSTLPELLNYYFPFAGRVTTNPANGSLLIACNNAGAELVEARANIPLSSIDFREVNKSLDKIILPFPGEFCLSMQLVSYPCGGFSIALGSNHLLVDGYTQLMMGSLWAELARTKKVSWVPCHDRAMFKPRTPLVYSPSIEKSFRTITPDDMVNVMAADVFVRRLYYVDAADLDRLRTATSEVGRRATRTEAFSAYLWKMLASVVGDADPNCRMGWLVDGRKRMGGALAKHMPDYAGNLISFATGEAPVQEVTQGSLSHVARLVSKAIDETANKDHFLELNDWFEANKTSIKIANVQLGLGSPAVVVSSCAHVSVNMDFGFGRPALILPQISWGRLASSFLIVARNPKNDGSWILSAFIWPRLAAALDSDPMHIFRPVTAEYLELAEPTTSHVELVSRL